MNGEKFFICLIIRMSGRLSSVTASREPQLADSSDENVICGSHPRNHRKIRNDKFASQTYILRLPPFVSFNIFPLRPSGFGLLFVVARFIIKKRRKKNSRARKNSKEKKKFQLSLPLTSELLSGQVKCVWLVRGRRRRLVLCLPRNKSSKKRRTRADEAARKKHILTTLRY